jgi:hypothetical protein
VALHEGELAAGTYVTTPFDASGLSIGLCEYFTQVGCSEDPADDSIRISFTVPEGWAGLPDGIESIFLADEANDPPDGAWLTFERGGWLYPDPCANTPPPTIVVGPTVADFVDALADLPGLDVTPQVGFTLDGFDGTYVEVLAPDDLSACPQWRPWEPGAYAQGPGHRWHLWVLDVDGIRVVVHAMDFAGTSAERQAELSAIVDSIQIEP